LGEEEIKLNLSYTERDYLAASRLFFFRSSETIIRLTLFSLLIVAGLLLLYFLVDDFPLWVSLVAMIVFEGAILYGVLITLPRRYFRGDAKFRDKWEFTFSAQGILIKTAQIDSKLAWSLYTRVIEGAEVFLLIYGKEIRTMTMVPKRAFQNRMQENAFRELVTSHITNQRSAQSASM
jgi:hypothetical protein